jgi:hypothetical protein
VLAQELHESVLQVANLRGLNAGDQKEEVAARLKLIAQAKSLLGLIMLAEGDKYENRSNPPTGFNELSSEAKAMLSAVTGYPQTILFGEPPGGLSTDNEAAKETMNRKVSSEQTKIRPNLHQLYTTLYAAKEGPTQGQIPDTLKVVFHPLEEPTEQQIADLRLTSARTDVIYLARGVLTPEDVRKARFGDEGHQLDVVAAEEVDAEDAARPTADASGETRVGLTGAAGADNHRHIYIQGKDRTEPAEDGHWHLIERSSHTGPSSTGDVHQHTIPEHLMAE